MSSRTRQRQQTLDDQLTSEDLDFEFRDSDELADISEEDIEAFLEDQEEEKEPGFWNLPTIAGLSIITVGIAYVLQEMGLWAGFDISVLANALPWLAGILIILMGFGVLNWKPRKKKRVKRTRKEATVSEHAKPDRNLVVEEIEVKGRLKEKKSKKKLQRSELNKKVFGVAGGIGEYFGVDPTLIRIAFVVAVIFGFGAAIPIYILLAIILPKREGWQGSKGPRQRREERITIIREQP